MGPAIVTRNELLASLRGRTLEIPDLQALLSHWPQYVHLELDRLRKDVDRKLHELFPEGKRLDKIKAADAGLFAASWWPYAPYEALKIATFLSIWLFVWDDELDSSEFSSLVLDYDRARSFRTETLEYAQRYLITNEHTITTKATTDVIIASFKPVAVAISESCSPAQIKTFMEEMRFFVDMTDVEQQVQMSMKLPSLEEYRQRRMGSSAVRMCLAITEYCFGMEIPRTVIDDDDMRVIWNETNVIISTCVHAKDAFQHSRETYRLTDSLYRMNDLLSVRKEIVGATWKI
ncbi:MAG: hypothetical protein L6R40_003066 [Gallowayella cf. fulva]|nr:MAG: hypothetical protein L6R40_003066 [Xanthomendoza cf. fulva]